MSEKKVTKVAEQLKGSLDHISKESLRALNNFKSMQVYSGTLLQSEKNRLSQKLGEVHPRVKRLAAKLSQNRQVIRDLEIEVEIARIKVPRISAEEALIHGRITDDNLRGISGLHASLQDEGGKEIPEISSAMSDPTGYYALKIDSCGIDNLSKKDCVVLAFRTAQGTSVYIDKQPLEIHKGDRLTLDLVLDRKTLSMVKVNRGAIQDERRPAEEERPGEPDIWVAKGKIVDQNDRGLENLVVSLYDQDLIFDDVLGSQITDARGNFRFVYRREAFRDFFEKRPDLYLKIMRGNGKILYTTESAVRCDAGKEEEFNIKILKKWWRF